MPKSFHVRVDHPSTPQGIEFRGEIPDEEWQLLLRFAQYADELTPLLSEGMEINCNINWDEKTGFTEDCA